MVRVSQALVVADNICDYIPVVSLFSNLVDLLAKAIFKTMNDEYVQNKVWSYHVANKPVSKCFLYMIPFYRLMTKVICSPRVMDTIADEYANSFSQLNFLFKYRIMSLPTVDEPDFIVGFQGPCVKGFSSRLSHFVTQPVPYIAFKVRDAEHHFYTVKLLFTPFVGWKEVDPISNSEPQFFKEAIRMNGQIPQITQFQQLLSTGEATDINGKKWFFDSAELNKIFQSLG